LNNRQLILAHFWLAFGLFAVALVLGAWQMVIRSPLLPWIPDPEWYFRSVTAHGTVMAYVFPTLVAMGFGYAITQAALNQALIGVRWAWFGLALVAIGAVTAVIPVALGRASVLYTFYPPLIGNAFFRIREPRDLAQGPLCLEADLTTCPDTSTICPSVPGTAAAVGLSPANPLRL
jgi:cytochrome c oxidase subunit I